MFDCSFGVSGAFFVSLLPPFFFFPFRLISVFVPCNHHTDWSVTLQLHAVFQCCMYTNICICI